MSNWLRDYGAAIGPGLAFLLGFITLFLKDRVEHRLRRTRAKQLLKQFKQLTFAHDYPEMLPVPAEDGYARGDTNRENHLRYKRYDSNLSVARAFMDANEKTIAEAASLEVLQQFYGFKRRFIQLADIVTVSNERPLNEGEMIMARSYHQLLKEGL